MATHSSVLAWRISWAEEPGGLPSVGSQRVRHDWSDWACTRALEKAVATHSSVPAWRIPGTGEPGGLPFVGSHRGGCDWKRLSSSSIKGLPWWLSGKESTCQCRRYGFKPCSGRIPRTPEQLSPFATTTEAPRPRSCAPQQKSHCKAKPAHCNWRGASTCHNQRKTSAAVKTQHGQKMKKKQQQNSFMVLFQHEFYLASTIVPIHTRIE